jgi:hypothetical protein
VGKYALRTDNNLALVAPTKKPTSTKLLYKRYLSYSNWRIPGHVRTVRMFKLVNQPAIGNNFGFAEVSFSAFDS